MALLRRQFFQKNLSASFLLAADCSWCGAHGIVIHVIVSVLKSISPKIKLGNIKVYAMLFVELFMDEVAPSSFQHQTPRFLHNQIANHAAFRCIRRCKRCRRAQHPKTLAFSLLCLCFWIFRDRWHSSGRLALVIVIHIQVIVRLWHWNLFRWQLLVL